MKFCKNSRLQGFVYLESSSTYSARKIVDSACSSLDVHHCLIQMVDSTKIDPVDNSVGDFVIVDQVFAEDLGSGVGWQGKDCGQLVFDRGPRLVSSSVMALLCFFSFG
jgi:hypothetical protein